MLNLGINSTLGAHSGEYSPQRKEERIGAADRKIEKEREDRAGKMKNEMQVPESDQTNRCQMRLKSVGWTGISHSDTITLAHYASRAWHNV